MRRRHLRERIRICALAGLPLISIALPPAASWAHAGPAPDRVDALVAPIAIYPDPLLAKLLIAATYPLEVDEAARWLGQHSRANGTVLDRAIASQPWDDSVKDLARIPVVLSMMDDRLEWTQNLGDTFLAQPGEVFASVQRLRSMSVKAGALRSTSQQKVTHDQNRIVIEPAVAQVINVPFFDPNVAYGVWPHGMFPPVRWTAPSGSARVSGIGFMTGIVIPAAFWNDTVDWNRGEVMVRDTVGPSGHSRVIERSWTHDPEHRRFVSYGTPQLRLHYRRDYLSGREAVANFRGYDVEPKSRVVRRAARTHGRSTLVGASSNATASKQPLSVFEDIDQGTSERLYSRRGNASILAAHRDNSHFAVGELTAAAAQTDTVAAR